MRFEAIDGKRLGAWCFAAVVPTAIQLCGMSWAAVGAVCVLCFIMALVAARWGKYENKVFGALRLGVLPVLLAQLLRSASECWPGDDRLVIPLTILSLGVWSAGKGSHAAARAGVVLFWVVLGLYSVVLASGVGQVRMEWLLPEWSSIDWKTVAVLLLPLVATPLLKTKRMAHSKLLIATIYIVGAAAVTAGVLSPRIAVQIPGAFYELSRSLNLLGVAQRFEAVVSAGVTVGWFALASLLLSVLGQQTEGIKNGWGRRGVILGGLVAAACMLFGISGAEWLLAACALVLWGAIPVLEYAFSTKNDRKKAPDLP